MRKTVALLGIWTAGWLGCAVRGKPPETVQTKAPDTSGPASCAANVAILERTGRRMSFSVENRSENSRSGDIGQVRLLFTAARCPLSLESPLGWSGSIDARAGQRACEVAWISDSRSGIHAGMKKEGFVALFKAGRIEIPSWAVFLDKCGVSGPQGPIVGDPRPKK
jgi:hypothetical protein